MSAPARKRGQPLSALVTILGLWLCLRVVTWDLPFPQSSGPEAAIVEPTTIVEASAGGSSAEAALPAYRAVAPVEPETHDAWLASPPDWSPLRSGGPSATWTSRVDFEPSDVMASHQLLYASAFRHVPVPRAIAHMMQQSASSLSASNGALAVADRTRPGDRWSLDAWSYWRMGGNAPGSSTAFPASYGASQAGTVLRMRLDPGGRHRPTAYLRATGALSGSRDIEGALGISARPLARLPVVAAAEVRLRQAAGRTEVRPAALAVTELAPLALPLGTQVESYAQAGYVGGRFATAFADGQVRVTRKLAEFDLGSVRVGAGAWGGAQKGAARLDAGPTASLDMRLGETPARLALDYRMRVAGDAEPGSGVALTLSGSF